MRFQVTARKDNVKTSVQHNAQQIDPDIDCKDTTPAHPGCLLSALWGNSCDLYDLMIPCRHISS